MAAADLSSSSMASSVETELNKARDSLRRVDDELRLITGRNAEELGGNRFGKGRNRFSLDGPPPRDDHPDSNRGGRFGGVGNTDRSGAVGIKRRITYSDRSRDDTDNDGGEQWKRPRIASEYNRNTRFVSDSLESNVRNVKPVVQSSVTMPLKETKSREDAISELKGSEKREMAVRNRRMFGVLLGTLKKFKKDEEKQNYKDQERKQKEIETRLEEEKRAERAQMEQEKHKLLDKRRRQEQEVRRLQRKRALIAASENQIGLLKRLQNFIQTNTKPPIFFMPAKHTIRTIELQKKTHKKLEETIKAKQEETEAQFKEMDDGLVMSHLDDEEDEHEEHPVGTESASLSEAKNEPQSSESSMLATVKPEVEGESEDGARNGDGDRPETTEEDHPVKPKDFHDELKELAADYPEELNFEDDEQQR